MKTKGAKRVAKRNTSIKINGKHYDALTGVLISYAEPPVLTAPKRAPGRKHTIKSIDGVVGGVIKPVPVTTKIHPPETKLTSDVTTPRKKPASRTSIAAAHARARQAKPSATLMRHAVAKPQATSLKRRVKVQSSTLATSPKHHPVRVAPKTSFYSVNHQRLVRAQHVPMHPKISRYAQSIAHTPTVVEQAVQAINNAIVIPQSVAAQHVVYRPDIAPARKRPPQTTSDIFEQALQRATSHEQPAPIVQGVKKARRASRILRQRMISYSAGAVAVLAIAGFFGMQHADTIEFKVASSKAGFSATMPNYQPAGFAIDSVKTHNGYVGLKYVANTIEGKRSYAITEKPSNWNSSTLLSYIMDNDTNISYRVVEKAGRTVYLYGNNQAAWVSNGILYQLASTNELGKHEIGQIAASM